MVRNNRPVHHPRQRVWPRGMSLGVKGVAKCHAVGRRHNAKHSVQLTCFHLFLTEDDDLALLLQAARIRLVQPVRADADLWLYH